MLLCLVERLGHEQEVSWLDSICQELVGCCDELTDNPGVSGGMHARAFGCCKVTRDAVMAFRLGIWCPAWTAPRSAAGVMLWCAHQ
jgi:hypothetical protein